MRILFKIYLLVVCSIASSFVEKNDSLGNIYDLRRKLSSNGDDDIFSLDRLPTFEKNKWIMYNRLPKAGSSTAMYYLIKCAKSTADTMVWKLLNPTYVEKSRHGLMGNVDGYSDMLRSHLKSVPYLLVIQHSYFTNFTIMDDYKGIEQPQYINIYRDPIAQSASHTDYLISDTRAETLQRLVNKEKRMRKQAGICGCAELSHKDCVLTAKERGCEQTNWYLRDETIRYLCGWQDDVCFFNTHSEEAYKLARDHLYQYVFVGLTEHYDLSMTVFQTMYPHFFCSYKKVKREYNTQRIRSEQTAMDYRRLLASFPGNKWDFKLHLHVVCLFWLRVIRDDHDVSEEALTSADRLVLGETRNSKKLSCEWVESYPHPQDYTKEKQKYLWPYVP